MFIEPCPAISGLEENHKIVGLSFFTVQTVHCEYEKKMNNKGETFQIGSTIESVPGSAGHVQMCKNGAMYPVSRSEVYIPSSMEQGPEVFSRLREALFEIGDSVEH